MDDEPKTLSEMPKLVMKNITDRVGAFDILSMRKVCNRLRTYLDLESPSPNFDTVSLVMDTQRAQLAYTHEGVYVATSYQHSQSGAAVSSNTFRREKEIRGEDPIQLLCNDLILNVVKLKSNIRNLTVDIEHENASQSLMERLPALLSTEEPLKVKKVYMTVFRVQELYMVLPFLDEDEIETIAMYQARKSRPITLSVDDIERLNSLEIWRTAKNIICPIPLASSASIHHFLHLKDFTFQFERLYIADVLRLKDAMLQPNSTFKRTQISYTHFDAEEQFLEKLGPFAHPTRNEKQSWYFRHRNNQILKVVFRPQWIFIGWEENVPIRTIVSNMF